METEKSLEKRIHDKLLAVRRGTVGKSRNWQGYSAPQLANDVVLNLAFAAEKGQLTPEQYSHFDEATRAELVCEFLAEARDVLGENRENYGAMTNKERARLFCSGEYDKQLNLDKSVYRLTRAQLIDKYGIENWNDGRSRHDGEVFVDDVLYGRFLRENGLTEQKGSEITEADLPKLDGRNSVMSRYKTLQRARL